VIISITGYIDKEWVNSFAGESMVGTILKALVELQLCHVI
jgi:hypothetical protein